MTTNLPEQVEAAFENVLDYSETTVEFKTGIETLRTHITEQAAEITKLKAQRPAGMEGRAIIFEECKVGHGSLRGENWIKHDCPYCKIARQAAEIERLRERVKVLEKCLNKYAKADVTCSYVHLESRSYAVYGHCETWAQKALAGKDGA